MPLHWHASYQSPTLTIGEYRCRPATPARGSEETTPRHSIVFVRAGVFVKHIRGRDVVADANHVVFFNGGQPYSVSHPVPGGDICTSFGLKLEILLDLLSEGDPSVRDRPETPFPFTHGPSEPKHYRQYRKLLRALESMSCEPLAVEESALNLIASVVARAYRIRDSRRLPARLQTARYQGAVVESAKLYIASHFRERFGLSQIARAAHTSPYHLCRLFKRETGSAIHQYQNRLRLRAALECLRDRRRDLTEVALESGYFDLSHFSNAFRREFGVSPSLIRSMGAVERNQLRSTHQ